MHLGVAEGDRCAPSSLFVPPRNALNVCFVQQKTSAPYLPPPEASLWEGVGQFGTRPSHPGMASHSFLLSVCFSRVTSTQKRPP